MALLIRVQDMTLNYLIERLQLLTVHLEKGQTLSIRVLGMTVNYLIKEGSVIDSTSGEGHESRRSPPT